jgi:hypothetical protein
MVRQKLLHRMLDQGLHRHAAQHGGKVELAVSRLGNAAPSWIIDPGFRLAGRKVGAGGRRRGGLGQDSRAILGQRPWMFVLLVFLVAIIKFYKYTILLSSFICYLRLLLPVPQVIACALSGGF